MVCSSWAWPNMFDVARGKVNLYADTKSLTNRIKLLLLTEPTELYNVPNFGVGLKKYIFRYNSDNIPAMIRDELIEQLRLWEPDVIPEETQVERKEVASTQSLTVNSVGEAANKLELTISVTTSYMQQVSFGVSTEDIV
jgi:phage baseplate assembly protein W